MRQLITGGTCAAAVLATSMAVFAQATQTPTPSEPATPASAEQASDAQQQTIVGCVQAEAAYRHAKHEGAGGAAGTGVGTGNEFVLVKASPKTSESPAATGTAGSTKTDEAVGTSGSAMGEDYELTGPGEGQLAQFVGKRVEVVGKVKASTAASDRSTGVSAGGATSTTGQAGAPGSATGSASGRAPGQAGDVDIMGQDLNLKEFEVVSVREASGSCPSSQR